MKNGRDDRAINLREMAEQRKRQRSAEDDGVPADIVSETEKKHPSKKARKETNASARRSLFVRSLPAIATSETLTGLFSESYPLKHATVVLDPVTKQSKGFGFVTFADAEDAQRALEEFNGHTFLGRKIKLEIAQPRSREIEKNDILGVKKKSVISAEAAALKKAREEKMAEARKPPKLIIRNLPWSVKTSDQLAELFRKFGKVKHADLPKVKDTQAGFGFVVMRGRKNAEKALAAINGTQVAGRTLAVDWAVDKQIWESQNKATKVDEAEESEAELEGGTQLDEVELTEEDDVANFMRKFGDKLDSEESDNEDAEPKDEHDNDEDENDDVSDDFEDLDDDEDTNSEEEEKPQKKLITDNSSTLFVRNLPFTTLDADLKEHFQQFGPVRYARVVMDRATDRPRGTGFVCFFNVEDADLCFRNAPRGQPTGANAIKADAPKVKHSLLENENADMTGMYTIEGRVMQVSRAVEKEKAVELTEKGTNFRTDRDKDKRKLYLLSEGTVASNSPLYALLAPSEIKMREDSAMQRKKMIQANPTLHLSLTRLSIRNLPRNIDSKALKALAREAVVGFAKDVKEGRRAQLSKEEEARGGDEMREAEKQRKSKGKGIVRQSKVVFEGREGAKVSEDSGAGRSRGYGFVEYSSHRWALMGLRWLNGHQVETSTGKKQRLIVEFAIENAQVVQRRKEKEEKARTRSTEVVAARARGELPEKEKKTLKKDQVMKKTREGMKGKGKPFVKGERNGKAARGKDGKPVRVSKGKMGKPSPNGSKAEKTEETKKFKPGFAEGEEGRLQRRAQIIQKKRMMRRNRKA
jgi:nucleolar protein 4